jgi:hypothetical protein
LQTLLLPANAPGHPFRFPVCPANSAPSLALQYSPGAAAYPDNLYAWPRCITCPPGTTSTGSRCVLTATASAAALFDEFD